MPPPVFQPVNREDKVAILHPPSCFALTKLQEQGECLSEMSVRVQCDNTPREIKNNVVTAFLASLVSKGTFGKHSFSSELYVMPVAIFFQKC